MAVSVTAIISTTRGPSTSWLSALVNVLVWSVHFSLAMQGSSYAFRSIHDGSQPNSADLYESAVYSRLFPMTKSQSNRHQLAIETAAFSKTLPRSTVKNVPATSQVPSVARFLTPTQYLHQKHQGSSIVGLNNNNVEDQYSTYRDQGPQIQHTPSDKIPDFLAGIIPSSYVFSDGFESSVLPSSRGGLGFSQIMTSDFKQVPMIEESPENFNAGQYASYQSLAHETEPQLPGNRSEEHNNLHLPQVNSLHTNPPETHQDNRNQHEPSAQFNLPVGKNGPDKLNNALVPSLNGDIPIEYYRKSYNRGSTLNKDDIHGKRLRHQLIPQSLMRHFGSNRYHRANQHQQRESAEYVEKPPNPHTTSAFSNLQETQDAHSMSIVDVGKYSIKSFTRKLENSGNNKKSRFAPDNRIFRAFRSNNLIGEEQPTPLLHTGAHRISPNRNSITHPQFQLRHRYSPPYIGTLYQRSESPSLVKPEKNIHNDKLTEYRPQLASPYPASMIGVGHNHGQIRNYSAS